MISSMGAINCGPYICIAASKMCPLPKVAKFSTSVLNGGNAPVAAK